jgi:hypothetical protein
MRLPLAHTEKIPQRESSVIHRKYPEIRKLIITENPFDPQWAVGSAQTELGCGPRS